MNPNTTPPTPPKPLLLLPNPSTSPPLHPKTHRPGNSSTDSTLSLIFPNSPHRSTSQLSSKSPVSPQPPPQPGFRSKPTHNSPKFITPMRALLDYFDLLSPFEQNEIYSYEEIYFLPPNSFKNLSAFDNEEGFYKANPGDHLEFRYEIHSQLGSGTFGEVFNCYDYKRHINVAVKIIRNRPIHRKAGDLEKKILHELSIADPEDLNCIVKKLRSFEFRGHLCLVFELLSLNLFDFLAKREFQGVSLQLVRRIAVQLFMAMKTVHSVGIIHCDLKPENILLKFENKSSIKVIDFGSACQEGNKVFDYIQSRYYRSPEVVIEAGYNKEIDIWSIGCILFELTTGNPLFPAHNEPELFKLITEVLGPPPIPWVLSGKRKHHYVDITGKPKRQIQSSTRPIRILMDGFDLGLIDLIEKCVKWNPEDRIDAEAGLSHGWVRGCRDRILN